ncbi:type II toxin-antitoxin system RelE/ParE family toxin [Paucilactobacillus sp. N302-9]
MYDIYFYEDLHGHNDIEEWITQLDRSHQVSDKALLTKIIHHINLLELLGPKLNEPHAKYLKGYHHKLFELRPIPERIFYAPWSYRGFVLLHHYTKRRDKTSSREVQKALTKLDDWIERMKDNDNLEGN